MNTKDWLTKNHHVKTHLIHILRLEKEWAGKGARRVSWPRTLAGLPDGTPCTVDGWEVPIIPYFQALLYGGKTAPRNNVTPITPVPRDSNVVVIRRPKSMLIRVSAVAIATARPETKGHCLLAMALRETLPGVSSIEVADRHIKFNWEGWRYKYPMPAKAADKAEEFDRSKGTSRLGMQPFEFRLDNREAAMWPVQVRGPFTSKRRATTAATPERKRATGKRWCKRRYHAKSVIA